jgi:peptidoglycan/LPS O-acetylase OafA/YrhL
MIKPNIKFFPNLDGLRLLLALMVFNQHSHLGETLKNLTTNDFLRRLIDLFSNGGHAVSFFFVLSGYLITYLMIEEVELSGSFSVKNFYTRRILRIWPLYYVTLIFSFLVYPGIKVWLGMPNQNPYHWAPQFFFLANFDTLWVHANDLTAVAPMMIGINWSVAIEEQFYLIWPVLFIVSGAKRFWVPILLVLLFGLTIPTFFLEGAARYYHTVAALPNLGMGALFGFLSFYSPPIVHFAKNLHKAWIVLFYVISCAILLYPELLPATSFAPYRFMVVLIFALVIVEQNFADHSLFKLSRFKWLTTGGKFSYSFYLLHPIGIQLIIVFFRALHIERGDSLMAGVSYALLALLASLALSVLSYHLIEKYFLELRRRVPRIRTEQSAS